jgi:hypothetical protein
MVHVLHNFQVFWTIVVLLSVEVVDYFAFLKIPTQHLFCDDDMLWHKSRRIRSLACSRVIRSVYQFVDSISPPSFQASAEQATTRQAASLAISNSEVVYFCQKGVSADHAKPLDKCFAALVSDDGLPFVLGHSVTCACSHANIVSTYRAKRKANSSRSAGLALMRYDTNIMESVKTSMC